MVTYCLLWSDDRSLRKRVYRLHPSADSVYQWYLFLHKNNGMTICNLPLFSWQFPEAIFFHQGQVWPVLSEQVLPEILTLPGYPVFQVYSRSSLHIAWLITSKKHPVKTNGCFNYIRNIIAIRFTCAGSISLSKYCFFFLLNSWCCFRSKSVRQ